MQPTDTVQMNIRIDRTVKEHGDAALATMGVTPTQAVRRLWEFAADHASDPETIHRSLIFATPDEEQAKAADRKRKREAFHRTQKLCESLGPLPKEIAELSFDELKELAYEDRLRDMNENHI